MEPLTDSLTPRRTFLKRTARIAAASALASVAIPHVHAGEDNTIRLALIGSGNRGSGAVGDAMSANAGPVRLVAMADVFQGRLAGSLGALQKEFGGAIDVPQERQFIGFDAYRKAIDCLRPGDVAMLTTHAAFRATHLEYAVEKGVHVFMEKTFAPDPGSVHQILAAGETAEKRSLKIAAGLMCRHSSARQAMIQRIRDGAMGQILLMRAYRMSGDRSMTPRNAGENELLWQIQRPSELLWVSAGDFIDLMIHQIDECCWIKDSWPVAAHGIGGRTANSANWSQNLDSISIEYTFADGAKALVSGRYIANCFNDFATYLHGTKCAGQFSGNIGAPTTHTYNDHRVASDNIGWKPAAERMSSYRAEWNALLTAIRGDRPHNEARRAAFSNLAAIMGRAAVHSGRIITWDEAMASKFRFCPNIAALTQDSPAPIHADPQGRYPVPIPGAWTEI
jgi:predicted dehydrogenase